MARVAVENSPASKSNAPRYLSTNMARNHVLTAVLGRYGVSTALRS
jgi:hypothetical protein